MKNFFQRLQQAARLMVGVGDYVQYCRHMREQHPQAVPMTETEYFRYCQQARYPSKDAVIKRCPC